MCDPDLSPELGVMVTTKGEVATDAHLSPLTTVGFLNTAKQMHSAVFGTPMEMNGKHGHLYVVCSQLHLRRWEYPFKALLYALLFSKMLDKPIDISIQRFETLIHVSSFFQ